jgi:hypothetical protein
MIFHQSFQPNARPAPHLGHIQPLFSNHPTVLLTALFNKPEVNKYREKKLIYKVQTVPKCSLFNGSQSSNYYFIDEQMDDSE